MTYNKISTLIKEQFPEFIRTDGPNFVAFLESYYEWMEQTGQMVDASQNVLAYRDIDNTLDRFVQYFQDEFTVNIPNDHLADNAIIIKNATDYHRARGSEKAYKFLFRILFNDNVTFFYPGQDILRASDGRWVQDKTITVSKTADPNAIFSMAGKEMTGLTSGATGIVEQVIQTTVAGLGVFSLTLKNIAGTFINPETVQTTNSITATTTSIVETAPGQFVGTKGFLNWDKFLQDNFFYQEYSYQLKTNQFVNAYRDILTRTTHPVGTKLFGKFAFFDTIDLASTATIVNQGMKITLTPVNNQLANLVDISSFIYPFTKIYMYPFADLTMPSRQLAPTAITLADYQSNTIAQLAGDPISSVAGSGATVNSRVRKWRLLDGTASILADEITIGDWATKTILSEEDTLISEITAGPDTLQGLNTAWDVDVQNGANLMIRDTGTPNTHDDGLYIVADIESANQITMTYDWQGSLDLLGATLYHERGLVFPTFEQFFNFTGGNNGTIVDILGVLANTAADTPRYNATDTRTNYASSSDMNGAVFAANTIPTGWVREVPTGFNIYVSNTGIEESKSYVELTFVGTNTTGATITAGVSFDDIESNNAIFAYNGSEFTGTAGFKPIGTPTHNLTHFIKGRHSGKIIEDYWPTRISAYAANTISQVAGNTINQIHDATTIFEFKDDEVGIFGAAVGTVASKTATLTESSIIDDTISVTHATVNTYAVTHGAEFSVANTETLNAVVRFYTPMTEVGLTATPHIETSNTESVSSANNRGILIEGNATNEIRNNMMVGTVAGAPGTAPNNWTVVGEGTTTEIVGSGVFRGIEYVDIRLHGTPTNDPYIEFETNTGVRALTGETWTESLYLAVVDGGLDNIDSISTNMTERKPAQYITDYAANTISQFWPTRISAYQSNTILQLAGNTISSITGDTTIGGLIESDGEFIADNLGSALSVSTNLERFSNTVTLSGGSEVGGILPELSINWTSGPIDITLRIGLPQIEENDKMTSVIKTSSATVTRTYDDLRSNIMWWFDQLMGGTLIATASVETAVPGSDFPRILSISDGTSADELMMYIQGASGKGGAEITNSVGDDTDISSIGTALSDGRSFKMGLSWDTDDAAAVLSTGGAVKTDVTTALPTGMTQLVLGAKSGFSGHLVGHIEKIEYSPRRVPNFVLQNAVDDLTPIPDRDLILDFIGQSYQYLR